MSTSLSWTDTLEVLKRYCPEIAGDVCDLAYEPFREYASRIFIPPNIEHTFDDSRSKLRNAISQYLRTSGCTAVSDEEALISDFFSQRVVLTGPHLQVLFDAEPFYGLLLSALGARLAGRRYLFWHANTTGRLNLTKRSGPGWLKLNGDNINLFNLPVRRMNALTPFNSEVSLRFHPTIDGSLVDGQHEALFRIIGECGALSLRELFHVANERIWKALGGDLPELVVFDDTLNSLLMEIHIGDAGSIINNILFDRKVLELQIDLFSLECNSEIKLMLPFGTDFFWHNRGDKFVPMRLNADRTSLISTEAHEECPISWCPEGVANALRKKVIVPNVYLMMMIFSILPSIRVNGGPRQIIYMPVIHRIAAKTLNLICGGEVHFDFGRLHGLGSDVIDPKAAQISEIARCRNYEGMDSLVESLRHDSSNFVEQSEHLRLIRDYDAWQAIYLAMK